MKNFELIFAGKINTDYKSQSFTRKYSYMNNYITPKRLTSGNGKLHKMLVFDLPAVLSCNNCASCKNTCYAIQQQLQYSDCRVFRNTNFHMANFNLNELQSLIEAQLQSTKLKVVRIHSSGDFFSQQYIDMWIKVISKFKDINFYAYTKVEKMYKFKKLANFNLITSLIEGKLNYGSLEYCNKLKDKYNAFICPCGINKDIKCGIDCNYCVTNKKVCFLQH